jgi:autotransporter-associated beta strand protein
MRDLRAHRSTSFCPRVETLEDRLAPASHVWVGAASNLWSNAANWSGGAPSASEAHVALTFPAGASHLDNQNDISGLHVQSLTFSGDGYVVTGSGITIGAMSNTAAAGLDEVLLSLTLPVGMHTVRVASSSAEILMQNTITGDGGLTKTGAGLLVLNQANTFAAGTTIAQGVVINAGAPTGLGAATSTITVLAGATLQVLGPVAIAQPLKLFGAGASGHGAIDAVGGLCTFTGAVTLGGSAVAVGADGGQLELQGAISGVGGLTKVGSSPVTLSGSLPNTYQGITRINTGVLFLAKSNATRAVPHGVVIGDNVGAPGVDQLRFSASDQLDPTAPITITSSGLMNLDGHSTTIGALTIGGEILIGAGTLTLGGNITLPVATLPVLIVGHLALSRPVTTVNVGSGSSVVFNGNVSGSGGLAKRGRGVLVLQSDNTYAGATTVSQGVLEVHSGGSLGASTATTTVLAGATLQAGDLLGSNSFTIHQPLNLAGAGAGGKYAGALFVPIPGAPREITLAGSITLQSSTVIDAETSLLQVTGNIGGTGALTIRGDGAGGVQFQGTTANTYAGATRVIQGGVLTLDNTVGAIAIPHDLIIAGTGLGGATVTLLADAQIAATVAVTIASFGELDLSNHNLTIRKLTMLGGALNTGTGKLLVQP